jgi:hypothetical protein
LTQINDALIGNVNYQGLWNASTNTPTLANPPASGTKGYYYIVSTGGTFAGISFEVGDWIISNGSAWQKVDNTDAVSSVFGRTGNVVAANGDYTTAQVTESGNLYYTDGRARGALSFAAGSGAYNTSTGVITIPTNNNQITNGAGYITSSALGGYVQGSGTTNYLPKFTGSTTIGNSSFFDGGGFGGFNSTGIGSRTFVINAASGRPLALEVVEFANVHSMSIRPNNSGFNAISSNYLSGGTFLPLSLSARENNSDFVLQTNGNVVIGTATSNTGKLVVKSGESNSTGIVLERGDNTDKLVNIFSTTADGKISISSGANTRIFLDSVGASYFTGGNLLVGTTTDAGFKLDVNGTGRFSGALTVNGASATTSLNVQGSGANGILLDQNSADANSSSRLFFKMNTQTYAMLADVVGLNFLSGATASSSSGSTKMILTSGGQLLVGTGSTDSGISVDFQNLSSSSSNVLVRAKNTTLNEDCGFVISANSSGTQRDYIIGIQTIVNSPDLTFSGPTGFQWYVAGSPRLTIASTGAATFSSSVTANGNFVASSSGTAEIRLQGGGYAGDYNTSLRSIPGAAGVLQMGNNNINYILVGNTAAGGFLSIRVNVSAESISSGTEALRLNSNATTTFSSLSGSGNRIVIANSSGTLISAVIGSGLAFDGTTLTATGGSSGSISGSGTSGTVALFTGSTSIGNSVITQTSGRVSINSGISDYHQLSVKSNGALTYQGLGVYSSSNDRFISMNHTGTEGFIETENAGSGVMTPLSFKTSGQTRLTIASTGAATFSSSVTATNGNFSGLTRITGVTGVPSTGEGLELYYNSSTGLASVGSFDRGAGVQKSLELQGLSISLKASGGNSMTITSGGNVLIGTTTDNGARLQVNGRSTFTGISGETISATGVSNEWVQRNVGSLTTGQSFGMTINAGTNSSDVSFNVSNAASTIIYFRVRGDGASTFSSSVTATSFFESSDATIKTLVEDAYQAKGIDSVVAKLYIKNGKQEIGYYAQDLESVLPSAVNKGSDGLLNLSYREVHTAKIAYLEEEIRQIKKRYEIN